MPEICIPFFARLFKIIRAKNVYIFEVILEFEICPHFDFDSFPNCAFFKSFIDKRSSRFPDS